MSDRLALMDKHLCEAIRSISDLARMLEAVRYTAGLGKNQWERVERARKVAADADQFLASISKESA
jgi:hypothetical protein